MEYYPKLSLLFSAHERETRGLGLGFGTNRKGWETVLVGSPLNRAQKNRQTVSADIGCDPQHPVADPQHSHNIAGNNCHDPTSQTLTRTLYRHGYLSVTCHIHRYRDRLRIRNIHVATRNMSSDPQHHVAIRRHVFQLYNWVPLNVLVHIFNPNDYVPHNQCIPRAICLRSDLVGSMSRSVVNCCLQIMIGV